MIIRIRQEKNKGNIFIQKLGERNRGEEREREGEKKGRESEMKPQVMQIDYPEGKSAKKKENEKILNR